MMSMSRGRGPHRLPPKSRPASDSIRFATSSSLRLLKDVSTRMAAFKNIGWSVTCMAGLVYRLEVLLTYAASELNEQRHEFSRINLV